MKPLHDMESSSENIQLTRSLWFLFFGFQVAVVSMLPFEGKFVAILLSTLGIILFIQKINKSLFSILWPLLLIVGIGIILGFGNLLGEPYAFFRDLYYFIQPLLLIFIGFMAVGHGTRLGFRLLLRLIIFGAMFLTIFYYATFLSSLIFDLNVSLELDTRYEFGLDSNFALIGFILVYISRLTKYRIFQSYTENLLIMSFLFLIIISFSRTNILITIIVLLYPFAAKLINFKKQLYIFSALIFTLVFLGSILQIELPDEVASDFSSKVINSYAEIIVRDNVANETASADDLQMVNLYWRSQEAFLGLSKYLEGNTLQLLLGQGFGTYVDDVIFFDEKFQQIPIFHNGFITVVLKTGAIGILLYFYFFILLARASSSKRKNYSRESLFIQLLLPCLIYTSLLKTFFIMGFYTPESPVLLLLVLGLSIKKMSNSSKSTYIH